MILVALIVLAVLAVLGKSMPMLVSVLGMAVGLRTGRAGGLRRRIGYVFAGALLGSVAAETVHTAYHLVGNWIGTAPVDHTAFYFSAVAVGTINGLALTPVVVAAHFRGRRRSQGDATPAVERDR